MPVTSSPRYLVDATRNMQPLLPGMAEFVHDTVSQLTTRDNQRKKGSTTMQRRPEINSQYGERHDEESALQNLQAIVKLLLTKKETAEFYSVSERTLDRWLLDGTIPANAKIIIGGSVRFVGQVLLDDIAARGAVEQSDSK